MLCYTNKAKPDVMLYTFSWGQILFTYIWDLFL